MNEQFILSLLDKFDAGGIGELEYSDGTSRLLLRKSAGGDGAVSVSHGVSVTSASAAASASAGAASGNADSGAAAPAAPEGEVITSPIVATFYTSAAPDTPPFVKKGSKVKAGETLCILEAMKMMNHLDAEFDCEILSIEAGSGDMVEYGQPLFKVKRL